ncbi:unnamed protein product [Peronospora effusa]|nr:unnamed protein product [Peronospora effusa]
MQILLIIFRPVNELHLLREGVYTLPPRRKRDTKLQTELDAIDELGGIELVEHMSSIKDALIIATATEQVSEAGGRSREPRQEGQKEAAAART